MPSGSGVRHTSGRIDTITNWASLAVAVSLAMSDTFPMMNAQFAHWIGVQMSSRHFQTPGAINLIRIKRLSILLYSICNV